MSTAVGFNPVTGQPLASPGGTTANSRGAASKALTHHHDPEWDPVTNQPKAPHAIKRQDSNRRVSLTSKFKDGSADKSGFNPLSGSSEPQPLEVPDKSGTETEAKSTPDRLAGKSGLSKEEYDPLTGAAKPRKVQSKVAGSFKKETAQHGHGEHQKTKPKSSKGAKAKELAENAKADIFGNVVDKTPPAKASKGAIKKEVAANADTDVFGNPTSKVINASVGGTVKREQAKNNAVGVFGEARPTSPPKATKGVIKKEVAANAAADIFGNPVNKDGNARVGGTVQKELDGNNKAGVAGVLDDVAAASAPKPKPKAANAPKRTGPAGGKALPDKQYDPLTGEEKDRKTQPKVAGSFKKEIAAHGKGDHQKEMERVRKRSSSKGATKKWIKSNSAADVMGNLRKPQEAPQG